MRKKKQKKEVDPIAERLKVPSPTLEKHARETRRPTGDAYEKISARHRELNMTHELASYETIDFIDDNDPEVQRFLKYLGLNPEVLEKAVVTVEIGKPVVIDAKGFAALEHSNGSVWK